MDSHCTVNAFAMTCSKESPLGSATYKGYFIEKKDSVARKYLRCTTGCGKHIPDVFTYHDGVKN
ncbi:hypothetical protein AAW51_3412 [Caldimonas brevitalea]|uniref:Uncharacterized protein n=2 Tax=Caldimonas brevitalea TaxID=413882 RepID=A0A0G3BQ41_9BURK|nr:hypothetical protein AAW51_3412 [Caldimonas brevitalea]